LDLIANKMYWTDIGTENKIRRADLDGSNIEDLVMGDFPDGIALDVMQNKMYFTNRGSQSISRTNLDGTDIEVLVPQKVGSFPAGISLDVGEGKMYWTDISADKIKRANFNGSGIEDVVVGLDNPFGITLIPEPTTLGLTILGLAGIGYKRYRIKKAA
jgi:DNA-binding beta-propeller fold protein YncE